jgi:hypothetical protein
MYAAQVGGAPDLLDQAFRAVQTTAAAMLSGWLAERVFDTGLPARGIGLLAGLLGLYVGSWVWAWGGWDAGPTFGSFPIAPAIAGAFGVCAILKLVGLGLAGPKW